MGRAKEVLQCIRPADDSAHQDVSGARAVFSEWKQDHAMAKERHEKGREPACKPAEVNKPQVKSKKTPGRGRVNEHDIPF
jgi:hypothetical protein